MSTLYHTDPQGSYPVVFVFRLSQCPERGADAAVDEENLKVGMEACTVRRITWKSIWTQSGKAL